MILRVLFAILMVIGGALNAAPNISQVTTPGGLTAWLVEERILPFVSLELRFAGGTSMDTPDKRGAVALMSALLEEGAGDLDGPSFARARDDLAASFRFSADRDDLSVSAKFLTETTDQALALLRSALLQPRFDQGAVERVKAQMQSIIAADQTDPRAMARRALNTAVFGDHPYGTDDNGTSDSLAGLNAQDLRAAWSRSLQRDKLVISAVGDISANDLARLLDELLAGLPQNTAPLPPTAPVTIPDDIRTIPYDTPQSVVLMTTQGVPFSDPDFFAAYLMNHILGGGGFESRLMQEIREKRGLTYGVSSYLSGRDHADLFVASFASGNQTVAEAVSVARAQMARIAANGVSEDELTRAKTYLIGSYPLRFHSNAAIARILADMQRQGFSIDYAQKRSDLINAVTAADVQRVAQRLFQDQNLFVVVVGQPDPAVH